MYGAMMNLSDPTLDNFQRHRLCNHWLIDWINQVEEFSLLEVVEVEVEVMVMVEVEVMVMVEAMDSQVLEVWEERKEEIQVEEAEIKVEKVEEEGVLTVVERHVSNRLKLSK